MKDNILTMLSQQKTWGYILDAIGIIATGGATFIHPAIAGFIGMTFIALKSPAAKSIAAVVNNATNNYASTETKLDDIAHAASEEILNK